MRQIRIPVSMSVSSLGSNGGTHFTPIINAPEVEIATLPGFTNFIPWPIMKALTTVCIAPALRRGGTLTRRLSRKSSIRWIGLRHGCETGNIWSATR